MNDFLHSSSDFFYTASWQQKVEEVDKAATWLSSLGLNIDNTRIAKYKNGLLILAEAYSQNTIDQLPKKRNFAGLVNSLNESDELIIIWRGLKQMADQNLVKRLKKFIKGPVHATDEHLPSSFHTARDIEFELYAASHFSSAGLPVDFGSDADLRIHKNSKLLLH